MRSLHRGQVVETPGASCWSLALDHGGADAALAEEVLQRAVRHAAVHDDRLPTSAAHRVARRLELGDHAPRDDALRLEPGHLVRVRSGLGLGFGLGFGFGFGFGLRLG